MSGVGHNSGEVLNGAAQKQLREWVDQIESLTDNELHDAKESIKEKYLFVKAAGFDVKTVRKIVKARSVDKAKRAEEQALFDLYAHALGLDLV